MVRTKHRYVYIRLAEGAGINQAEVVYYVRQCLAQHCGVYIAGINQQLRVQLVGERGLLVRFLAHRFQDVRTRALPALLSVLERFDPVVVHVAGSVYQVQKHLVMR